MSFWHSCISGGRGEEDKGAYLDSVASVIFFFLVFLVNNSRTKKLICSGLHPMQFYKGKKCNCNFRQSLQATIPSPYRLQKMCSWDLRDLAKEDDKRHRDPQQKECIWDDCSPLLDTWTEQLPFVEEQFRIQQPYHSTSTAIAGIKTWMCIKNTEKHFLCT